MSKNAKEEYVSQDFIQIRLAKIFDNIDVEREAKKELIEYVYSITNEMADEASITNKLNLLFEYEKNHLELIKEHKEEIKFANNIQAEIRKERTQFFTQDLKEVARTLKDADVESEVASKWIKELVDSYTKSLNLSSELTKTNTINIIAKLREESNKKISELKNKGNNND